MTDYALELLRKHDLRVKKEALALKSEEESKNTVASDSHPVFIDAQASADSATDHGPDTTYSPDSTDVSDDEMISFQDNLIKLS